MPTTIQLLASVVGANNAATESLSDTFVSQFGRHITAVIPVVSELFPFPWPSTGETMLYVKFPQQSADYDVGFLADNTQQAPFLLLTILAGSGFVPVMLPKAHQKASDQSFTYWIFSTSIIPTLPMFYF